MLEDKDIQKIKEGLATKEDLERFATKEDLENTSASLLNEILGNRKDLSDFKEEMRENFSDLQSAVDAYAKKADAYFQEMVMLSHKVDRNEKWIQQLAKKLGVKLEY
jgi:uncharacterized coiled-coil DUF342 family protein